LGGACLGFALGVFSLGGGGGGGDERGGGLGLLLWGGVGGFVGGRGGLLCWGMLVLGVGLAFGCGVWVLGFFGGGVVVLGGGGVLCVWFLIVGRALSAACRSPLPETGEHRHKAQAQGGGHWARLQRETPQIAPPAPAMLVLETRTNL